MASDAKPGQRLVALFAQQVCWKIGALATALRYSIPSVRRFLAETGYHSSFTHNGGWYTLRSIPRFGRDGLWFFRDIGFSRVGSLTKTLIDLTNRSPEGLTAEQLGEKLRCRCHSILVQLFRHGRLQREKLGRAYIYVAVDPHTAAVQRQARTASKLPEVQLPAEIAVWVLVEFIRNPEAGFEQISKAIARSKNIRVEAEKIQRFFEQNGLKKTKSTSMPKPCGY